MNIDGATAVIYAELGFAGPLARGLFCLSRSVGALAHAWEQMQQGGRNKGPTPPAYRWTYTGPNPIDGLHIPVAEHGGEAECAVERRDAFRKHGIVGCRRTDHENH
jgi:hypothetical protein